MPEIGLKLFSILSALAWGLKLFSTLNALAWLIKEDADVSYIYIYIYIYRNIKKTGQPKPCGPMSVCAKPFSSKFTRYYVDISLLCRLLCEWVHTVIMLVSRQEYFWVCTLQRGRRPAICRKILGISAVSRYERSTCWILKPRLSRSFRKIANCFSNWLSILLPSFSSSAGCNT